MRYELKNSFLTVEAETAGGELVSIRSAKDGFEYLWQADPEFWKRHAPVLFPIVGNAKNKTLLIGGKPYPMGQHGFARDMEFRLAEQTENRLLFRLDSDAETGKRYPYDFCLEIGYELDGNSVETTWKVTNTGKGELHYQIGGHPAFNCPPGDGKRSDCMFLFDREGSLEYGLLDENGLLKEEIYTLQTQNGFVRIRDDMFDKDALIIENAQCGRVSLCGPDKNAYLTVLFDSPLFGLWSPAGKRAPFVCIEPWFGRADRDTFEGSIEEREYDQCLKPAGSRTYCYTIRIDSAKG